LNYNQYIHCIVRSGDGKGQALLFFRALALSVGKKQLFCFFSVGLCVGKKTNVLFVRLVSACRELVI